MAAYEQYQKRDDTEHVYCSNLVSDDEDEDEYTKQGHTPRYHIPLSKPVSRNGNLTTTKDREENVHDIVSPGTHLLTQPPTNVIPTDIEEENMSPE